MNEGKRNNRLQLLNEHVDLYFLLRNFGVQIIPLQIITFFSEESPYTHVSVISTGVGECPSHHWFWFFIWLVEEVEQNL